MQFPERGPVSRLQVHHRATGARREAAAAHDSGIRRDGQKFLADQRLFMGRLAWRED